MRHRKKINHLSRTSAHRKAMLANMATSLIIHKRIHTTLAKAKALRGYVEPLITKSKTDTTHSRRIVFSYLKSKEAVTELFREVSAKVGDRPGGYTRIIKIGSRLGDNAEMCMMELVDFNENLLGAKESKAKSTRRRRRGGSKKTETTGVAETAKSVVEETAETVAEKAEEVKEEVVEEAKTVEQKAEEVKEEVKKEEPKAETPSEEPKAEEKKEEETSDNKDDEKKDNN
jgi:large subunit ribosomal protein L17